MVMHNSVVLPSLHSHDFEAEAGGGAQDHDQPAVQTGQRACT